MAGGRSYAIFRIENKLDHGISFYMNCRTSDGTIAEMSGRHSPAAGAVRIVDSRRVRFRATANNSVLVNCSIKSHSLASVSYLIRDGRIRNFGNQMTVIHPQTS